jgi:hypothetical protein
MSGRLIIMPMWARDHFICDIAIGVPGPIVMR